MSTNLIQTTETQKLKISTSVQVYDTIELDIDLPYFCKGTDAFYKIITPEKALRVTATSIIIASPQFPHVAKEIAASTAIEEYEFENAVYATLSEAKQIIEAKGMSSDKEHFSEDDLMERRAS